jgi:hypothetical protein
MTLYTTAEKLKIWGAKFLIEDFFYRQDDLEKNKAEAVDKIQTFWMIFTRTITEFSPSEDKILARRYMGYLQGKSKPLCDQERKPPIDEVYGWFSSEKRRDVFREIYESDFFDYKKYEDLILAFNLVDALLDQPEIWREVRNNCTTLNLKDEKKINEKNIIDIFQYQKNNNYPLINYLYTEWVHTALTIVGEIIDFIISEISPNSDKSRITSIHHNSDRHDIARCFLDDNSRKRLIFPTYDLIQAIIRAFSFLSLDLFGICKNKNCPKKNKRPILFVKFPVHTKAYCSNKCAAYVGTYRNRQKIKK